MSANRVEKLVYWYLRFNGYFIVENFTVHPDRRRQSETEIDFLAVRFPNSREEPEGYEFSRDPNLVLSDTIIDFVVVEAKSGLCAINENSWGNPERRHIQYALKWMGFLSDNEIEAVAEKLYEDRSWKNDEYSVRFVCFGCRPNEGLEERYPGVGQILLERVVKFVLERLTIGCHALHRENWDPFIQDFVTLIEDESTLDELKGWVLEKENESCPTARN